MKVGSQYRQSYCNKKQTYLFWPNLYIVQVKLSKVGSHYLFTFKLPEWTIISAVG